MTKDNPLRNIAKWRIRSTGFRGMPSICSAHPLVIEAAMGHAQRAECLLLVEATCNQVNQDGGYTGMTPSVFRVFVENIAHRVGFPLERLILGGDHLGPNPWKNLPADQAMQKGEALVDAYVKAGFTKLHLDTSMGCAGEPPAQTDEVTAARAARLAAAAESAAAGSGAPLPVYVIGTEVPVPGGAMEEIEALEVTRPEAAVATVDIHRAAFLKTGLDGAFSRVIAAVVQPGVEFGNHNVIAYEPAKALALSKALGHLPGMVFEAHSTDYQTRDALRRLVADGFAILKVGPGLTFALREALYGLSHIAAFLHPSKEETDLPDLLEAVMLAKPEHWQKYYHGSPQEQRLQRHFSYSDRIRYYWPQPKVDAAVGRLFGRLGSAPLPETLVSQYLHGPYNRVRAGTARADARSLALAAVDLVLEDYFEACRAL